MNNLQPLIAPVAGMVKLPKGSFVVFEPGRAFECEVAFVREPNGFSAHVVNLPGASGQGSSIEEARTNIAATAQAVIGHYIRTGSIPWSSEETVLGEVACYKRILVDIGKRSPSNDDFLRYAADNPIPQTWYDEEPQTPPQD